MNCLKNHYTKIVSQDLLIKYMYKNPEALSKFQKVSLSTKFSEDSKGAILSFLEVLTFHKPCLTLSKVNSLSLNLRKGQLVGVKITLRKNHLFAFLQRFLIEILPLSKKLELSSSNGKYAHIQFKNLFGLEENKMIYIYFQGLTSIDVVIENSNFNFNLFRGCRFPVVKK